MRRTPFLVIPFANTGKIYYNICPSKTCRVWHKEQKQKEGVWETEESWESVREKFDEGGSQWVWNSRIQRHYITITTGLKIEH